MRHLTPVKNCFYFPLTWRSWSINVGQNFVTFLQYFGWFILMSFEEDISKGKSRKINQMH